MPEVEITTDSLESLAIQFKRRLDEHAAAWSQALDNREAPAAFYSPSADIIFIDPLPPFAGYHGWREFQQSLPPTVEHAEFRMHDGVKLVTSGDTAWTIAAFHLLLRFKNGQTVEGDARQTAVWQRQADGQWLIVHLHESMPLPEETQPYQATADDLSKFREATR